MDVRTLCLGVLSEGGASGYEIKKKLEQTYRHFFQASFGSIYPALSRMTEDGLVSCTQEAQAKRPDKKVYELTARGRMALIEELMAPPGADRIRSEFLVTMLFAELLPVGFLAQVIDDHVARQREHVASIDACDANALPAGKRFVMGYGRAVYAAVVEYIEENRHLVEGEALMKQAQGAA